MNALYERNNTNGIAVENIVWTNAPTGLYQIGVTNYDESCPQGLDYDLFIQIDGVNIWSESPPGKANKWNEYAAGLAIYEGVVLTNTNTYELFSFFYTGDGGTATMWGSDFFVLPEHLNLPKD